MPKSQLLPEQILLGDAVLCEDEDVATSLHEAVFTMASAMERLSNAHANRADLGTVKYAWAKLSCRLLRNMEREIEAIGVELFHRRLSSLIDVAVECFDVGPSDPMIFRLYGRLTFIKRRLDQPISHLKALVTLI